MKRQKFIIKAYANDNVTEIVLADVYSKGIAYIMAESVKHIYKLVYVVQGFEVVSRHIA